MILGLFVYSKFIYIYIYIYIIYKIKLVARLSSILTLMIPVSKSSTFHMPAVVDDLPWNQKRCEKHEDLLHKAHLWSTRSHDSCIQSSIHPETKDWCYYRRQSSAQIPSWTELNGNRGRANPPDNRSLELIINVNCHYYAEAIKTKTTVIFITHQLVLKQLRTTWSVQFPRFWCS